MSEHVSVEKPMCPKCGQPAHSRRVDECCECGWSQTGPILALSRQDEPGNGPPSVQQDLLVIRDFAESVGVSLPRPLEVVIYDRLAGARMATDLRNEGLGLNQEERKPHAKPEPGVGSCPRCDTLRSEAVEGHCPECGWCFLCPHCTHAYDALAEARMKAFGVRDAAPPKDGA